MNENQRADFEALITKHGLCLTKENGLYRSHVVGWMSKAYEAALESPEVQALRDALKVANDALEEISNEMNVGDRWTNAGQSLLDSLPVTRAALAQGQGEKHDNQD